MHLIAKVDRIKLGSVMISLITCGGVRYGHDDDGQAIERQDWVFQVIEV